VLFNHPTRFNYSSLSFINVSDLSSYNVNTRSKNNKNSESINDSIYPSSITSYSLLQFFKSYLICYKNKMNGSINHEQKSLIHIIGSMNFIIQEILINNFTLALSFVINIFDDMLIHWDTKLLEMKIQVINFFRIFILITNRPKLSLNNISENLTSQFNQNNQNKDINKNKNNEKISLFSTDYLFYDYKKHIYRLYLKIQSCEESEFIGKFIIGHILSKEVSFGEFINNQQKQSYFEPSLISNNNPFFSPIFLDDVTPRYTLNFQNYQQINFNNTFSQDEVIYIKWAFYNLVSDIYYFMLKIWQDHINDIQKLINYKVLEKNKINKDNLMDDYNINSSDTELTTDNYDENKINELKENIKNTSLENEKVNYEKNLSFSNELSEDYLNIELNIFNSFNFSSMANKKHVILMTIQILLFLYKKWGKLVSIEFTDKLIELLSIILTENESLEIQIWVIATLAQICNCYSNCKYNKSSFNNLNNQKKEYIYDQTISTYNNFQKENVENNSINTSLKNMESNIDISNPFHIILINRFNLLNCINPNEITWNSIWSTLLHKVINYSLVESSFYCLGKIIQENILSDNIIHSGCNILWKNVQEKSIPLVPSSVYFILNYLIVDDNSIRTNKALIQNLLNWLLAYFQIGIDIINQKFTEINNIISMNDDRHPIKATSPTYFDHNNSNMIITSQSPLNFIPSMRNSIDSRSKPLNKEQFDDKFRFVRTPQLISILLSLFVTSLNLKSNTDLKTIHYNQFKHYIPKEEMSFEIHFFNQYLHLNFFNYGHIKQFIESNRPLNSHRNIIYHCKIKDYMMHFNINKCYKRKLDDANVNNVESIQKKESYEEKKLDHVSIQERVLIDEENLKNNENNKLKFYSLNIDNEFKSTINTFFHKFIHDLLNIKSEISNLNEKENGVDEDSINIFNNDQNNFLCLSPKDNSLNKNDNNGKSIKRRKINSNESITTNYSGLFNENQSFLRHQSIQINDDTNEPSKINQEIIENFKTIICWKIHFLNIFLEFVDILLHSSNQTLEISKIDSLIENYNNTKSKLLKDDIINLLFPNLLNEHSYLTLLSELFESIIKDLSMLFQYERNKDRLIPVIECLENCFNFGDLYNVSNYDPFSTNTNYITKNSYNGYIVINKHQNNTQKSFNFFKDTFKNSILLKNIFYKLLLNEKNIDDLIQLLDKYYNFNIVSLDQKQSDNDDFIKRNKDILIEHDMNTNKSLVYMTYYHPFIYKPEIVYLKKLIAILLVELTSINISKNIKYNNKLISLSNYAKSSNNVQYSIDYYSKILNLLTPNILTHCQVSFQIAQFIHINKGLI